MNWILEEEMKIDSSSELTFGKLGAIGGGNKNKIKGHPPSEFNSNRATASPMRLEPF